MIPVDLLNLVMMQECCSEILGGYLKESYFTYSVFCFFLFEFLMEVYKDNKSSLSTYLFISFMKELFEIKDQVNINIFAYVENRSKFNKIQLQHE